MFGLFGRVEAIADLNGDRRAEIVVSDVLTGYFPIIQSPSVTKVVGWDGRRYTERTDRFPQVPARKARAYQLELLQSLRTGIEADQETTALGYYANMTIIGQGAIARKWLVQNVPRRLQQWLYLIFQEMTPRNLRGLEIRSSQARVLGE